MSWLDDIQKELEKSRNHPVRKKKEWEIDRDIRLKGQAVSAGKSRSNDGIKRSSKAIKDSGWYDSKEYKEMCKKNGIDWGKKQGKVNVENGHMEKMREKGLVALEKWRNSEEGKKVLIARGRENAKKYLTREVCVKGGNASKEHIQSLGRKVAKIEHHCPKCGRKGNGNGFKGRHFDNCGIIKKIKKQFDFNVYDEGKLIKTFDKTQDAADWYGCSPGLISMFVRGVRTDKRYGYTWEKVIVK